MDEAAAFLGAATRSVGPWFTVWAVRRKWKLDRKLNPNARLVRWGVVIACYSLCWRVKPAEAALAVLFVGLAFLCWPNFAYHLARLFERWPMTRGEVTSARRSGSRWQVDYSFEFEGQRYGGTSKVKRSAAVSPETSYREGETVTVQFDPLNPEVSAIIAPRA